MSRIDRRNFLKFGAMSAPFALLSSRLSALAPRSPSSKPEKLLVIFGRGGNDPLNTFPPHLDSGYQTYRTTPQGGSNIHLPSSSTVAVPGTSYFRANPNLQKFVDLIGDGRAAILGRVGNPGCRRSHFTEMRIKETGKPGSAGSLLRQGWGGRLAQTSQITGIKAASHTPRGQRLLLSTSPTTIIPTIPELYDDNDNFAYEIATPQTEALKLLEGRTQAPTTIGLRGHVGSTLVNTSPEASYAQGSGDAFFKARDELMGLSGFSHSASLFPRTGTEAIAAGLTPSPEGEAFMAHTEEAMFVLQNTGALITGVDLGSFDTHTNQIVQQGTLLGYVAHAMESVDALAQADPTKNYLVLFITEFGRTVKSNASDGTDHGIATCYMAAGDNVNAKAFNMGDPATEPVPGTGQNWQPLAQSFPATDPNHTNAVVPATDFRTVFAEIVKTKFGLTSNTEIDGVLGHAFAHLINGDNLLYRLLGFLQPCT